MKMVYYKEKRKKRDKLKVVINTLIVLIVVTIILLVINLAFWGYNEYLYHTHPIYYSEVVEKLAREHNIDKFLIYAIIKTESRFNPDAVSNAGARGLMQLMPDTFDWIKEHRLLDDELVFNDMFVPEHNLRYGVYLISYHMRHYNNIDNSLAAYHAGDGAVDKWLMDRRYSKDGKTLDNIPISNTAHYVHKVNTAYKIYLNLYGV